MKQEEIRAWLRATPETDPGKQIVRALQREIDDLRRMYLQESRPPTDAERYIRCVAHRDFSEAVDDWSYHRDPGS